MDRNDLLQSLDRSGELSEDAKMIHQTLETLTAAIVGRLISERLIDYAGQPGQTIEYLSACVGDAIVSNLDKVDTVELDCFWKRGK